MIGRIVSSKAGRDSGKFMVVVGEFEGYLLVCDGKERPLKRPKKKKPKHLSLTNSYLSEDQFNTNRKLLKSLKEYSGNVNGIKEEK